MTTLQEKIAVMKAFADGKAIEWKYCDQSDSAWREILDPNWDWNRSSYRIKREPREFWVNIYPSGSGIAHPDQSSADNHARIARIACIKTREVIE